MGIMKRVVENVTDEVVKDATAVAAVGAIGLISAAVKTVGTAGTIAANTVEKVIDKRNTAVLKKDSKKNDYCLFVNKETKIGQGIYSITDKLKEEKYNTLIEGSIDKDFIIRLYSKSNGEIGNISKTIVAEKRLFFSDKYSTVYILHSDAYSSGTLIESNESNQKIYFTDFNNWMIIGELSKNNYKIFDKVSGKTVAVVSKKYKNASMYMIDCDDDKYESIIVLITILIDIVE